MQKALIAAAALLLSQSALGALITDPNDPRTWQGANVGAFAQLFFGVNNATTRQQVVDNSLLDDGLFNTAGFTTAPLIQCNGCTTPPTQAGKSLDTTGTGSYGYIYPSDQDRAFGGSHIDQYWIQTGNGIGGAVWDLGPNASTAVIFNTIDHGPLPQEAIESTVYLSNDLLNWVEAETGESGSKDSCRTREFFGTASSMPSALRAETRSATRRSSGAVLVGSGATATTRSTA